MPSKLGTGWCLCLVASRSDPGSLVRSALNSSPKSLEYREFSSRRSLTVCQQRSHSGSCRHCRLRSSKTRDRITRRSRSRPALRKVPRHPAKIASATSYGDFSRASTRAKTRPSSDGFATLRAGVTTRPAFAPIFLDVNAISCNRKTQLNICISCHFCALLPPYPYDNCRFSPCLWARNDW